MGSHTSSSPTLATVETAFEVVRVVQRLENATLTEIADELGLAKSTAFRHVSTLVEHGYLVRDADDTYRVGLRFLDHGTYARNRNRGFDLARTKTQELANETGEVVTYAVVENGREFIICKVTGENAVQTRTRVGEPLPPHATASGKSILAHLPAEEVDEVIETHGLPRRTSHTITTEEELFDRLETIRERGYAVNEGEYISRFNAVAVPVIDADDRVLGALSVGGPKARLTNHRIETSVLDLLRGAVNELELNVAMAPS